jgi:hypothetical protein
VRYELPSFPSSPPIRCQQILGNSPSTFCGKLARWEWLVAAGDCKYYFCDQHKHATDVPIATPAILRRIVIECRVAVLGVSVVPALAHAEALARLEAAVAALGGGLDVDRVTSALGRCAPSPAPGERNASGDDGR